MKKQLFILLFPILSWSQTEPFIYDLLFVKSDSVVVYEKDTITNKTRKNRELYIYNNLGYKIKEYVYENNEIYSKSEYTWVNDEIKTEKTYSQVYKYDSIAKDWLGKIYENDFYLYNCVYENDLLKRKEYYKSIAGNISLDIETAYEYDSLNRLKKETNYNRFKGYLIHYPDYKSVKFDSITLKKSITTSYKTYHYNNGSILINYFKNDKVMGKEKIIGTLEKPIRVLQLNAKNEILKDVIYLWNQNQKVVEIKILKDNFITLWGMNTFQSTIDKVSLQYDDNGINPIEVKYISNGENISSLKINYYAP